ncbi:MAG: hypothetical protein H8D24_07310 [Gammaproteobacteria bacterium]|uniref:CNP1-like uncharacterized domain-containing protein n=1 Tax=Candidatus Thiopontia autotrophica TaxID=2841688 RepID=A0A8J6NXZ9_9GAMM|nr:hypothetical protein [Candidatus Thiopontia autotrophica]MBL6968628.1 hypothetical protein [Gammaproteobacteria bacterium]
MKRIIVTFFILIFSILSAADANWWDGGSGSTYYEEGDAWKESEISIPDYPQEDNLLEFQVDNPSSSHRYFLDTNSLSIADDYVIRYSAVIKTRSGSTNVFYDGMRCQTMEYKNYAFGINGSFTENDGAHWEPVRSYDFFRKALLRGIVCEQGNRPRPVDAVIDKIKYNR